MALQVSTGVNSLVALGLSISDAATLISLGARIGNWWTTRTEDADFLNLLDMDEMTILPRRGLFDLLAFNKRWGQSLHILANGKPQQISVDPSSKLLGSLSKFTASMICAVAILDEFTDFGTLKLTMKKLLEKLFRTHEHGQEMIISQLSKRVNAWRSAAVARGLSAFCRERRAWMIKSNIVQSGFFPEMDCDDVVEFLYWLFASREETFHTNSSDTLGIALNLTMLGFDTLSIEGCPQAQMFDSPLRLVYTQDPFLATVGKEMPLKVNVSTCVSLVHPEECFSNFPIDHETATRCRNAWRAGAEAAKFVSLEIVPPVLKKHPLHRVQDLEYKVVDHGSKIGRPENDAIFACLSQYALTINSEVCESYTSHVRSFPASTIRSFSRHAGQVRDIEDVDDTQADMGSFCIHQAFFMGYYYSAFLKLVDTNDLEVQMVEGLWGFGDTDVLFMMQSAIAPMIDNTIQRERLFAIFARLLLASDGDFSERGLWSSEFCLGLALKRTLVCNSLLKPCFSPSEIGGFTLIDVDTSGIPRDHQGVIRSGLPSKWKKMTRLDIQGPFEEPFTVSGPDEDFTKHIEADWHGNPDKLLMVLRYKGRRIGELNPATADFHFCARFVPPVDAPEDLCLPAAWTISATDMVAGPLLYPPLRNGSRQLPPTVIQAYNKANMRYGVVGLYGLDIAAVASNSVRKAVEKLEQEMDGRDRIVVAGYSHRC